LIERRADPNDRRAKRLFLTPAAKPVMERLDALGEGLMTTVLDGIDPAATALMLRHLEAVKDNLRSTLSARAEAALEPRKSYG
jgi:MarR family transcriptional regulator, transcriptional regulator for hemolysin